jgi:hypothetical protein
MKPSELEASLIRFSYTKWNVCNKNRLFINFSGKFDYVYLIRFFRRVHSVIELTGIHLYFVCFYDNIISRWGHIASIWKYRHVPQASLNASTFFLLDWFDIVSDPRIRNWTTPRRFSTMEKIVGRIRDSLVFRDDNVAKINI